jgi:isoamylase
MVRKTVTANDDRGSNGGVEDPITVAEIERLRTHQVKTFMTVTMLSLGLPMFLMGDEVRRTQHGNNNAYCQDNEANWFDWSLLTNHADMHRFVKLVVARRTLRDSSVERERMTLIQGIRAGIKSWRGVKLNQPGWSDQSQSVALSAESPKEALVYLIFNAYWQPPDFELPRIGAGKQDLWRHGSALFTRYPKTWWRGKKHPLFLTVRIEPGLGL